MNFLNACTRGDVEDVKNSLKAFDLCSADEDGRTPLIHAAYEGHTEVVRLLVGGSDLRQADHDTGDTALMHGIASAGINGVNMDLVNLLIPGSDLAHTNTYGWTALTFAAFYGATEIIVALLPGSDPHHTDGESGKTPLIWAACEGHIDAVQLLITERGLQQSDRYGNTALFWAAASGHHDVVQSLLEHGADHQAVNINGENARMAAQDNDHLDIVKTLIDHEKKLLSHVALIPSLGRESHARL